MNWLLNFLFNFKHSYDLCLHEEDGGGYKMSNLML